MHLVHDYFGGDVAARYDEGDERFGTAWLGPEVDLLADLAGSGGRALELAIGTGRVALPLRERGVDVHGVDLSEAMVARLRAKPGGAEVPVTIGDMSSTVVPGAGTFDLVYLVYNTIGNLADAELQHACFANAARHPRPGGAFLVETHTPGVQHVAPGERYRVFTHREDYLGFDEYDRTTQLMWSHHYRFAADGTYRRNSVPFRYTWPAELDAMARAAGLRPRDRWGGWTREPFTGASERHVSTWVSPEE
ncbi:MAG: SAM-dependent methyltransferase [Nocardioides sp.]|nr:SAM-dependent methyltransferase [Nocardioides sp.]